VWNTIACCYRAEVMRSSYERRSVNKADTKLRMRLLPKHSRMKSWSPRAILSLSVRRGCRGKFSSVDKLHCRIFASLGWRFHNLSSFNRVGLLIKVIR
jgi:hypothetical protein